MAVCETSRAEIERVDWHPGGWREIKINATHRGECRPVATVGTEESTGDRLCVYCDAPSTFRVGVDAIPACDEHLAFSTRDALMWIRAQLNVQARVGIDMPAVPADWPVQPLTYEQTLTAAYPVKCGQCGREWDDAVVTSMTPAPGARCPFEPFHP